MRKILPILFITSSLFSQAQHGPQIKMEVPNLLPMAEIVLKDVPDIWEAGDVAAPQPEGEYIWNKRGIDSLKKAQFFKNYKTTPNLYDEGKDKYLELPSDLTPDTIEQFLGIDRTAGVPNDNHMAISNAGMIVTVVNSWVTVLSEDGDFLMTKSLTAIVLGALGRLDRTYDPKVIYDPAANRFILTFLQGTTSNDTRIIVGFSKTEDPTGAWNFYQLEGNPFGGEYWSDYPIIAQNEEDFFVTINILRDNSSWQEGFTQSLIWQVNKDDGYRGEELRNILWADIQFGAKSVWSICPVQPAEGATEKDLFLLSVRPADSLNDTLFVHHISNTVSSGKAAYSLKVLKTPKPYGLPPSALQPVQGFMLQTNDCRVLSGMYHQGRVQYVQTTAIPNSLRSGVFHGLIDDVYRNAEVHAEYIYSDSADFGYPSIAFSGTKDDPQSSLITFSHTSENSYPGTSVVAFNRINYGALIYSPVLRVKEGEGIINSFIPEDDQERWGDYTQVQRRYNAPGEMWVCGSFGNDRNLNGTWISALKVKGPLNPIVQDGIKAFPVPANESVTISFDAGNGDRPLNTEVNLFATDGQLIKQYGTRALQNINQKLVLNLSGVQPGMYFIEVKFPGSHKPERLVRKLIIE